MTSVGGVTCDLVAGSPPDMATRCDVWEAPGHDGIGWQELGAGDGGGRIVCQRFASAAVVATWAAALRALQGTAVTVINDFGESTGSVFIAEVSQAQKSAWRKPGTSITTRGVVTLKTISQG